MTNIANAQNPFFEKYTTPYGTVPFDKIKKAVPGKPEQLFVYCILA